MNPDLPARITWFGIGIASCLPVALVWGMHVGSRDAHLMLERDMQTLQRAAAQAQREAQECADSFHARLRARQEKP